MKEHKNNCECGRDHSKPSLQKFGMSKIEHRDKIANLCEEMYQVGIMTKDKSNMHISNYDGKEEPSFVISEKFAKNLLEHYQIQDQIEYLDKQRGIDSQIDYGGFDRESYIMGIAINDFTKITPKDCKTCRNLVLKKRGDEDAGEVFMNHWKKDHPDLYKAHEELGKHIKEWIILLKDFMEITNRQTNREWRSN